MWVEAVPNFSDGRDLEFRQRISEGAQAAGVSVLGVEGDWDHDRSVLTLAGPGEQMIHALMTTAELAVAEIDLTRRRGVHPRIGAVDVIPLIPLGETPMDYVIALTHELGQRLADELALPVFLYEQSAPDGQRPKNLADVRRGGFEGLARKMADHPPDYGPSLPHPSAGAVAVGARYGLVAFNCYLSTQDVAVARSIASKVRSANGGLPGVKALGLPLADQGAVQVSMNLVDYPTTTLAAAVDAVTREALGFGVQVVRCELIGLMPVQALLDVAVHFLHLPRLGIEQVVELNLNRNGIHAMEVAHPPASPPEGSGRSKR